MDTTKPLSETSLVVSRDEGFKDGYEHASAEYKLEVERLKKELELQYWKGFDNGMLAKHGRAEHVGYQEGVVEGERRAMERVKEAIDEVFKTAIICAGNDTKTVRLLEGVKGYLLYKLEKKE